MHTTNEQTEHEWHLRNWETHLWFYDLHCLIFPVGRMKVCVYFFPRQLWSLPSRKWSSGVCKGNLALIVKTNTAQPALCSPWAAVGTTAAGSILLSNTGRRRREKHHELVSVERERTLGIINSNRPMTVNREEPVWAAFYFNHPPICPASPHFPPPQHLMKYVQGKQRWGWCADLPLWLTATRPVPLLIYKACRVSARVASLASLHAIRALS